MPSLLSPTFLCNFVFLSPSFSSRFFWILFLSLVWRGMLQRLQWMLMMLGSWVTVGGALHCGVFDTGTIQVDYIGTFKSFDEKFRWPTEWWVWCTSEKKGFSNAKKQANKQQKTKKTDKGGGETDMLPSMMCFLLRPLSVSALQEHKTQKMDFKDVQSRKEAFSYNIYNTFKEWHRPLHMWGKILSINYLQAT